MKDSTVLEIFRELFQFDNSISDLQQITLVYEELTELRIENRYLNEKINDRQEN